MNKKYKNILIVSGYFAVFLLTFVFMGGLEALLQFATESSKTLEAIIIKIITKLGEIVP